MAGFSKRRKFTAQWTPDRRGVKHPSKGEAEWTNGLYDREERGEIRDLNLWPKWTITLRDHATGEPIDVCDVKGDASFFDVAEGRVRFFDYKADEGNTDVSVLKRKLVRVVLGVDLELAGPARAKQVRAEAKKAWDKLAREQARATKKKRAKATA